MCGFYWRSLDLEEKFKVKVWSFNWGLIEVRIRNEVGLGFSVGLEFSLRLGFCLGLGFSLGLGFNERLGLEFSLRLGLFGVVLGFSMELGFSGWLESSYDVVVVGVRIYCEVKV